MAVVIHDGNA